MSAWHKQMTGLLVVIAVGLSLLGWVHVQGQQGIAKRKDLEVVTFDLDADYIGVEVVVNNGLGHRMDLTADPARGMVAAFMRLKGYTFRGVLSTQDGRPVAYWARWRN